MFLNHLSCHIDSEKQFELTCSSHLNLLKDLRTLKVEAAVMTQCCRQNVLLHMQSPQELKIFFPMKMSLKEN